MLSAIEIVASRGWSFLVSVAAELSTQCCLCTLPPPEMSSGAALMFDTGSYRHLSAEMSMSPNPPRLFMRSPLPSYLLRLSISIS